MPDNPVETHYSRGDLYDTILAALKAAGKDTDHLTPDDLAPVDEFHGGQRPATIRLAELVDFTGIERVLDVGSGLGGPSRFLAWRYGCRVSGVDLTAEFVRIAEALTQLTGLVDCVDYRQGSALDLPFEDMSFDVVWSQNVAMNIADRPRYYAEMRRVLKPGGIAAVLEFSRIWAPLASAYDWYSFNVLPRLGRIVAGDEASYRYLAESIRMHPDQGALAAMMEQAGFDRVELHNLAAGAVALHLGYHY